MPTIDYDFGPNWELGFAARVVATRSTDHLLVKMIIERRFQFIKPRVPRVLRPGLAISGSGFGTRDDGHY
jgi:hypothetical protein